MGYWASLASFLYDSQVALCFYLVIVLTSATLLSQIGCQTVTIYVVVLVDGYSCLYPTK